MPAWPDWRCPASTEPTLEPILTYCAERRCEADNATCPGCRLRMEKLGIKTFDDFVAATRRGQVRELPPCACAAAARRR